MISIIIDICNKCLHNVENSARTANILKMDDFVADEFMLDQLDILKCYVRSLRVLERILRLYDSAYISAFPRCDVED